MRWEKESGLFSAKHPPGRSGKRVLTPFPSPCLRTAQSLTANKNAVGPLGTRGNM